MDLKTLIQNTRDVIGGALSVASLKRAGHFLAAEADRWLPGGTGAEKKAWAKAQLGQALEAYDDRIPVIGAFMDLPAVDAIERSGIDMAVEYGYAALHSLDEAPAVTNDPDLQSGGLE